MCSSKKTVQEALLAETVSMETDDVASGDCMTGLLQFLSLGVCSCHMTRGEIGTKIVHA